MVLCLKQSQTFVNPTGRVNHFKIQAENWYVARLNIKSAFWWLEIYCVRDKRDMKLNPTFVKSPSPFCAIKKSRVSTNTTQTARRNKLKIDVKVE